MPERCWTLIGVRDRARGTYRVRAVRQTSGQAARVQADWAWSLKREEEEGDVQGFFHTHPSRGGIEPSPMDIRSMRAWTLALGKPLLCLIAEEGSLAAAAGYLFAENGGAMRRMRFVSHEQG